MDTLSVNNLTIDFETSEGNNRAIDGVSFSVPENRTVALVGESGSGKSVISQAIMGILPEKAKIQGGEILFCDPQNPSSTIDIASLDPSTKQMRSVRGNRIAIIFQEPMTSLSPLHTIGDQIGEAARLHRGMSSNEAKTVTLEMLRLVQFPNPLRGLSSYTFELSGGLRQRAMIAMALVCHPALLIADEPTTALDVTIQAEILKLIKEVQSELKMSVLMITHDFGVVANVADEVVVIYHGQIMESGSIEQIFKNPGHQYLKALLEAVPRFDMRDDERLKPIRPITTSVPEFMNSDKEIRLSGTPLMELDGLQKEFHIRKSGLFKSNITAARALDNVNFMIKKGECLGLVGESGSGKTTTAKAILKAVNLDKGNIYYHSGGNRLNISDFDSAQLLEYRRKVQMIFQDPFSSLNPRMTINEILSEPLVIHKICSEQERLQRVRELMDLVGLDPRFLRRYPHSFSGGQRQRIGIARGLALQPELLLCDEPVSALDVSVQAQILNLLKDLKDQLGLTYLFVSHNLAVVDYIADRIAVMCKGRLVELGETHQIINNPKHPYTKALLESVPEPSLSNKLDFDALSANQVSDPAAWPEPFRISDSIMPTLTKIDQDHFICAPGLE